MRLVRSPEAGEDADDGDLVAQDVCRVLHVTRRGKGRTAEVGEVESALGFEQFGVREKDFTFMVPHITPFSEIGFGDGTGAVMGSQISSMDELGVVEDVLTAVFCARGACRS